MNDRYLPLRIRPERQKDDFMTNISAIPLTRIDGSQASLGDYAGKVVLVVNVASKCGLTKQYEGLEALYRAKKNEGFEILGFPANNFKGQEPGTDDEIASFCTLTYDVTFPMFSKISVKGEDIHPLYHALTEESPVAVGTDAFRAKLTEMGLADGEASDVLWNFEKFLIGRDGKVIGRYSPSMTADDPMITADLEKAIAA
jgi:glutathione peroxidase